jgi:hypothetical protein
MPCPLFSEGQKTPHINAGKYQGQTDGTTASPIEHCPENIFHGKQSATGNNGEKQKTKSGFFHYLKDRRSELIFIRSGALLQFGAMAFKQFGDIHIPISDSNMQGSPTVNSLGIHVYSVKN